MVSIRENKVLTILGLIVSFMIICYKKYFAFAYSSVSVLDIMHFLLCCYYNTNTMVEN